MYISVVNTAKLIIVLEAPKLKTLRNQLIKVSLNGPRQTMRDIKETLEKVSFEYNDILASAYTHWMSLVTKHGVDANFAEAAAFEMGTLLHILKKVAKLRR